MRQNIFNLDKYLMGASSRDENGVPGVLINSVAHDTVFIVKLFPRNRIEVEQL